MSRGCASLQSTSGKTASINLTLQNSNNLKFQSLTITGMNMWQAGNRNISVLNNTVTGQVLVQGSGSSSTLANILIDGNSFDAISVCASCYEGRLQLNNAGGVTVSNNHFGGPGESDGIQWGGYGGVVGPGNVFDGIVQGSYGRHVDAIQLYGEVSHHTITKNYFRNNSVCIMAPDGGTNVTITDNVFAGNNIDYGEIQMGSQLSPIFTHNTVYGMAVGFNKKSDNPTPSSNALVQNNIFVTRSRLGVECSSCTFNHNLFDSTSQAYGNGNIIGNPTFTGGTKPSAWAGWQLTSSSLGRGECDRRQ
jgi:hypothetical protein